MAELIHEMPLSDITKNLTIELKITGMWRFRLGIWLLTKSVQFAAWVGQFNVNVDTEVKHG